MIPVNSQGQATDLGELLLYGHWFSEAKQCQIEDAGTWHLLRSACVENM